MTRRFAASLIVVLLASGCATVSGGRCSSAQQEMVSDVPYFGTSKPAEREPRRVVRLSVDRSSRRVFPMDSRRGRPTANGTRQGRDSARSVLSREHRASARRACRCRHRALIDEYKSRFRQESVLRVTSQALRLVLTGEIDDGPSPRIVHVDCRARCSLRLGADVDDGAWSRIQRGESELCRRHVRCASRFRCRRGTRSMWPGPGCSPTSTRRPVNASWSSRSIRSLPRRASVAAEMMSKEVDVTTVEMDLPDESVKRCGELQHLVVEKKVKDVALRVNVTLSQAPPDATSVKVWIEMIALGDRGLLPADRWGHDSPQCHDDLRGGGKIERNAALVASTRAAPASVASKRSMRSEARASFPLPNTTSISAS